MGLRRVFPSKKYYSPSDVSPLGAWYRRQLPKHPFLLFGLPFISMMVAGSFFLTPATALRYEKHDLKTKRLSREEAFNIKSDKRKFDIQEEYFKLSGKKDVDNWENKRYPRKPGDHDGIL